MKKFVYILVSILLWSCGGGGDDSPTTAPPPPAINKAPSAPTQSAPTNNQLCIDNTVEFQWNASTDPEGNAITYELQIATNNQFTQNLQTKTSSSTSTAVTFDKGVAYYWRIKAKDNKNASSSYSSIFNFYTEGEGESNHLPFSPGIVQPTLNAIVQGATVTLEWTASDVDTSDTLTFDVYFGTVNPPTEIEGENQSETNLKVVDLSSSTDYYWKVVVKDDKGGETIGQIWNFKTD